MPPLLVVLVAVPAATWLLTALALIGTYDVVSGAAPSGAEWALGGTMALLSVGLLALAARAVWQARGRPGAHVLGALVVVLSIGGVLAGLAFVQGIIAEKEAGLAREITEACGRFDLASATCPELARRCVHHVRTHPPPRGRGESRASPDPRAPREPQARAVHECIAHGGPAR